MFLYHGRPVSAQDAADILAHRLNWRRAIQSRQRDKDRREGTILRQLWSMIWSRMTARTIRKTIHQTEFQAPVDGGNITNAAVLAISTPSLANPTA